METPIRFFFSCSGNYDENFRYGRSPPRKCSKNNPCSCTYMYAVTCWLIVVDIAKLHVTKSLQPVTCSILTLVTFSFWWLLPRDVSKFTLLQHGRENCGHARQRSQFPVVRFFWKWNLCKFWCFFVVFLFIQPQQKILRFVISKQWPLLQGVSFMDNLVQSSRSNPDCDQWELYPRAKHLIYIQTSLKTTPRSTYM